jgi:hypothetical protein
MSTQTDTEKGKQLPKHLEVFSEPRTYPAQWDVSGLSKLGHKQNDEAQPESTAVTTVAPQEIPETPEVSFSDWQLGAQLDRYDTPDTSHFSVL